MRQTVRAVAAILFGSFCLHAGHAAPPRDDRATLAKLDTLCRDQVFSGALLLARPARPVLTFACGIADRERQVAMRVDTPLRLASVGKVFTAVAVMQLIEAGKIDLDAPIASYLPDYPDHGLAAQVTIRHLLTHTGGTGDFFDMDTFKARDSLRGHADYIRRYGARTPRFAPGSKHEYSNFGFILLGRIIETVSGEDYYTYIQRHVFDAARMRASSFPIEDPGVVLPSECYRKGEDGALHPLAAELHLYRGVAAGGGFSSVGDMRRFAKALFDGTLISKAMAAKLAQMPADDVSPYAYGFKHGRDEHGRIVLSHGGNGMGSSARFMFYPADGTVIVVLANLDSPSASRAQDVLTSAP